MSKNKPRRINIPDEVLARARAELQGEEVNVVTATPKSNGSSTVATAPKRNVYKMATIEDLKQDYAYVIKDMQSMALLAFALIIGMLAVAFVLLR